MAITGNLFGILQTRNVKENMARTSLRIGASCFRILNKPDPYASSHTFYAAGVDC